MKKVSIIIPCYNQEKYIEEALQSATNQTYKNIEIVCIDDCSKDNSFKIIEKFTKTNQNIVFCKNENNMGVIATRNKAISLCTGEYILPLDADDIIEPTYIEKAVKILDANQNIGIVYCNTRFLGKINENLNCGEFNNSDFLYYNCICCTALFRKTDFFKAGGYKESMNIGHEDHDLWLSILEQGLDAYKIDETLFYYRKHNNSRTNIAVKNQDLIFLKLLENHFNLYKNDAQFQNKICSFIERLIYRRKKCQKIYKIIVIFTVIEFLILFSILLLEAING